MKASPLLGIVLALIVGLGALFYWRSTIDSGDAPVPEITTLPTPVEEIVEETTEQRSVVRDGSYVVSVTDSTFNWAGKKPLIDGYINAGSLALQDGIIEVASTSATGKFTVDMNTLSVSATPKKPGKESLLEEHLKGDGWFDVATYPTAVFTILEVKKLPESDTTFVYDVRGELTMKGKTNELTFPATIYADENGTLHADATLTFDRTKWGITAGSGSFFDNLADNVVDDMVELSFSLVAEPQQ